jgi:hypothetical protein
MIHDPFSPGLDDLAVTVERSVQDLSPHQHSFTSIVTSGVSGLVVASPVAVYMGMPLVIVREGNTPKCWHASETEGVAHIGAHPLFLDDHIHLGRTFEAALHKLARAMPSAHVVATYEYAERKYSTLDQKLEDIYHRRALPGASQRLREDALIRSAF